VSSCLGGQKIFAFLQRFNFKAITKLFSQEYWNQIKQRIKLMHSGFLSALKTGERTGFLLLAVAFGIQPLFGQKLTHGPFVGGVTAASARFYLRVDAVANVNVQLSTTKDFAAVISGEPQTVATENDFTALIRVDGLAADSLYYYRAEVNGVPAGEVRQFRTFPPLASRAPFLFTFGSCQQNQPWRGSPTAGRVFKMMAGDLPRFFLQIGDWGYPDSTDTANDSTDFSA
jgi:phosphodiesterase/alkaline phosphatase D-like protein